MEIDKNLRPKFSIVVPVYNAKLYLKRCIDSILSQTFDEFELILVNDGSTDGSGDICNEFKRCDARIKVINGPNKGVSSARNKGIENACGEYITFIDADDEIELSYLENMSKGLGFDLIVTGFCYENVPMKPCFTKMHVDSKECISECITEYLKTDHFCFPWARAFKAQIIREKKIRFDTKVRFGEDHIFNWEYLCCIASLWIDSSTGYHKRQENNSGIGYRKLSLEEIEYLDRTLFRLKMQMQIYYKVEIFPAPKDLFHILFVQDYVKIHPISFYATYYRQFHPGSSERDVYDFLAKSIYHSALFSVKTKVLSLEELNNFIDEPVKLFIHTKIKSRVVIPLIKLHAHRVSNKIICKMLK